MPFLSCLAPVVRVSPGPSGASRRPLVSGSAEPGEDGSRDSYATAPSCSLLPPDVPYLCGPETW